ncbi:DUF2512 family protein [Bacillus lacus]|uniref:DUF2512 family protein n=1 Tax=Metabacillus lacus TaxID=1983721 RepID=A0A7X2IY58_9BACI|nr:DUF2512 family protein [Metabacillus lacus]MRX71622.1 DUF2512 family protein [Metabacillus lacus]
MNHGKALAIKALLVLPVLLIVLTGIYDVPIGSTILLGVVLIVAAYLLGDMMVLPKMGNVAATIADFGLAFLVLWIGLSMMGVEQGGNGALPALIASILLAAGEWFYHKWLLKGDHSPRTTSASGKHKEVY